MNIAKTGIRILIAMIILAGSLMPGRASGQAVPEAGTTERVSVASDGTQGNGASSYSATSADGRYVAFESQTDNLVGGDTNGTWDIFLHDRVTGETTRISVASDGAQGNDYSARPSISADGRYVAFESVANNLVGGDTNLSRDIFVHDEVTGETRRVSIASDGTQGYNESEEPSISADGRYVAFESGSDNLVGGDTNGTLDIFVHDRVTDDTSRVSVASDGTQGNNDSYYPSIAADGRYVAFYSYSNNLVEGDTNGTWDVFVHDRETGETTRVSVASDGTQGNGPSSIPSISDDGRYVAFESGANNLVGGDTNEIWDIFVHDRATDETRRVSVASDGAQGNGHSLNPSIAAEGRFVAFVSYSDNLVGDDAIGYEDAFVHDQMTGETIRVSVASDGTEGNADTEWLSISADGRYVAFYSYADNLVDGDTNGYTDVFVHDLGEGGTVYSISGRVIDAVGYPVIDVEISSDSGKISLTDSDGNYMLTGLITGTYTLTPGKDGYAFNPASQVVSVPPDASGIDFTGSETLNDWEIIAFVDESCTVLDSAGMSASDISQVGDYFLDKQGEDSVKLVVDSAMNIWALAGVDWGLVGKGLNHIATPGYKAAIHASWNGWTEAGSAARHWYKPLYDSLQNDRNLLFSTTARSGLRYYSEKLGFEVAKDWLLANLVPGAGTPFADDLGEPAVQLGASYCQELTWAGEALIDDLPPLTPEQIAAYRADFQARQLAHTLISEQVQGQRDLLWDSYQDALADEQNWWKFWGPLLLKYAVIGGATLAFDGPGYVVASAGTAGVSLIYDAVADSRALAHDQKMLDQSLYFFDGRISGVYSQVSLNSVAAFNLIRAGDEPQIAKGTVDNVSMNSYGHYRIWPGLWWAEDSSEAALTISNTEVFSSTYLTSAGYNHTGFWVGAERLLPEGEALELQSGEQGTAIISFKMEKDGLSPDEDSQVDMLVLGASETGIYPVSQVEAIWSPTRIETLTGVSAQPPSGYTLEQANAAPAYAFPLTSFVNMAVKSTNPLLTLVAENPFTMTVSATLTQTIPADFTIIDAGGGQQVGDALVWTEVISPGAGVSWQAVFGWQSLPGETINLPGAVLAFSDPNTGEGDTYQAGDEVVKAGWPIETTLELPDHLTNGKPDTITVTLAHTADGLPVQGTFTLTLSALDGTSLFAKVIEADLGPSEVIYSQVPVQVSNMDRYVVVRGLLELNGVVREVYLDIVPLYKIAFIPMVAK